MQIRKEGVVMSCNYYYLATAQRACKCAYVCLNCGAVNVQTATYVARSDRHRPESQGAFRHDDDGARRMAKEEACARLDAGIHRMMENDFNAPRRLTGEAGVCPNCGTAQPWSDACNVTRVQKTQKSASTVFTYLAVIAAIVTIREIFKPKLRPTAWIPFLIAVASALIVLIAQKRQRARLKAKEAETSAMIDRIDPATYARCAPVLSDGTLDLGRYWNDPRCRALAQVPASEYKLNIDILKRGRYVKEHEQWRE